MKVIVLPFSLPGFRIDHASLLDQKLLVAATAIRAAVSCPDCQQVSARVHSRYTRLPRDLPVSDWHMLLHLSVRRFFCDSPTCPRRTFAERLPDLVAFRAQRTQRFTEALHVLGFAEGGRAAARTATRLRLRTSRNTLLRVIRQTLLPPAPSPRVLGIDDVAFRKGHVYGTILIDLERHCPIDLLPDRDAELIEAWLRQHPEVQIVSRDRSTEYTRGVTAGAPQAVQVADRWHLLVNLREALERVLDRHHSRLRERVVLPVMNASETTPGASPILWTRRRGRNEEAAQVARRERRMTRYQEIMTRYQQGGSMRQIAAELHVSRWLVQRFVKASEFPEQAPRPRRGRILIPFTRTLAAQWAAGERNAMAIWRTVQAEGYTGSAQTIRRWLHARRQAPAPQTRAAFRAAHVVAPGDVAKQASRERRLPAPRKLVWLLLRDAQQLTPDDAAILEQLRQESVVETAYVLAQRFLQLVRQRQANQFDDWLTACHGSNIPDLQSFAAGLKQDEAAVRAALKLPWSNGQVEGQNTRLKMLKRQMYGRASFALLRQRLLYAA